MNTLSKYIDLLYDLDEVRSQSNDSADMIERRMATLYSEMLESERKTAEIMHKTLGIPSPDQKGW